MTEESERLIRRCLETKYNNAYISALLKGDTMEANKNSMGLYHLEVARRIAKENASK